MEEEICEVCGRPSAMTAEGYKGAIEGWRSENARLTEENAKYRKALEEIAENNTHADLLQNMWIAREALGVCETEKSP